MDHEANKGPRYSTHILVRFLRIIFSIEPDRVGPSMGMRSARELSDEGEGGGGTDGRRRRGGQRRWRAAGPTGSLMRQGRRVPGADPGHGPPNQWARRHVTVTPGRLRVIRRPRPVADRADRAPVSSKNRRPASAPYPADAAALLQAPARPPAGPTKYLCWTVDRPGLLRPDGQIPPIANERGCARFNMHVSQPCGKLRKKECVSLFG